jgi:hypothetical protein
MPKNILILPDDTGQAGGLRPDENRSNVYKLYRATRCGPDTDIDPRDQLAFRSRGHKTWSTPPGRWPPRHHSVAPEPVPRELSNKLADPNKGTYLWQ